MTVSQYVSTNFGDIACEYNSPNKASLLVFNFSGLAKRAAFFSAFENKKGSTSCKSCPRGTLIEKPESELETCDACPAGWSNNDDGSTNCVENPFGSYMQADGVEFLPCQQGHSCAGGVQYKEECLPGSAAVNQGSFKCLKCTPGMYASSFASVKCTSCRLNHFANQHSSSLCK